MECVYTINISNMRTYSVVQTPSSHLCRLDEGPYNIINPPLSLLVIL